MSVVPNEHPDSRAGGPGSRNRSTGEPLSTQIYDELRRLAARQLRSERVGHTLQATALVHEAWLRLSRLNELALLPRSEILFRAAREVRQVLVDHARRRARMRRGGDWRRITLKQELMSVGEAELDLLELDEALQRLSQLHPRQATIVELRFFGGMSVDEVASALDVAPRTVDGDWKVARAWLARELEQGRAR